MEKRYDDEMLIENFEEVAKAYSSSLKNRGFIFLKFKEEDCQNLISEIVVIMKKLISIFDFLQGKIDCTKIKIETIELYHKFCARYNCDKNIEINLDLTTNNCFLYIFSLENYLNIKLIDFLDATGEYELFKESIQNRSKIYAENLIYFE